jgi:hypothetical protein
LPQLSAGTNIAIASSINQEQKQTISFGITGIITPTNGGTGNSNGRIQIG